MKSVALVLINDQINRPSPHVFKPSTISDKKLKRKAIHNTVTLQSLQPTVEYTSKIRGMKTERVQRRRRPNRGLKKKKCVIHYITEINATQIEKKGIDSFVIIYKISFHQPKVG